ncbi:NUDIX hydrolase [Pleurocapsales cyanobacterium LEGE 10410]|nr:NUDIX hydrolase [Pleurocapsales cyanobacterium LEGE 10410]
MTNFQNNWQTLERFVEIRSSWLTLIGEKLQDEQEQTLDYWRVEKADSVVIVTMQSGRFLLPKPSYRPGLGQATLDFPGGRVLPEQTPVDAVPPILKRELGVNKSDIISLNALNQNGWAINSSFSNQKLYGFIAEIKSEIIVEPEKLASTIYPTTAIGIDKLLQDLTCLQCRAVLLEWQRNI